MKLRHLSILSALLVCAALSLPAPSSADEVKWPRRLVISVPASGNVVHMIVTALGKTIEEHTPVERVIVQPIGGPASWLPRMEKGQVDLAVHAGPDTVELLQGLGVWKEKTGAKPFLRTVIAGNRNLYGVITVPGKGIEKWPDLKGKVAFFRQPGNPLFDRVGTAILESAGLSEADLKASLTMINFREASTDIIEGRVDAALSTGSGPFMMELEQAAGTNLYVQPSEEEGRILMTKLPVGFYLSPLPAKAPYFNNSHAIERAIMYRNAIYARADMDPEVAYAIIKAIDENRDAWKDISPITSDWGEATELMPPYHEGVVRYYREKGMWTDAMQEHYARMLAAVKAEK